MRIALCVGICFVLLLLIICVVFFILHLNNRGTENLATIMSHAKHNATIDDMIGTWEIKDKGMPVRQLTVTRDDIVQAKEQEKHHLGCPSCNKAPTGAVIVQPRNVLFKKGWLASRLKKCTVNLRYIYKLVLHPNGIVKFVIDSEAPFTCKLLMVLADSKNLYDMILNLIHRARYGCFCLGILKPDGKEIQRYNRWGDTYPSKFYTMVKT